MAIDINNIIVKIRLQSSERLLAQVEVIFFNVVETKGWRIMTSKVLHPRFQEPIWIQPPSFRAKSSWHLTVYINDRRLYEFIEEKIYDEFHKTRLAKDKEVENNVKETLLGNNDSNSISI